MQEKNKDVQIRFTSQRTLESSVGHLVRTITERDICKWLSDRGIDHTHASEVIIVKASANDSASLFVPDIMLTKRLKDGRAIVIETLHNFSPKRGGLKAFAAFGKQYKNAYYSILVGKKANLETVPKGICDARVDCDNLNALAKKINPIARKPELRIA